MMSMAEFLNRLRILMSIDKGDVSWPSDSAWEAFRDDPFRTIIRCDDKLARAIYTEVERRQNGLPKPLPEVEQIAPRNWQSDYKLCEEENDKLRRILRRIHAAAPKDLADQIFAVMMGDDSDEPTRDAQLEIWHTARVLFEKIADHLSILVDGDISLLRPEAIDRWISEADSLRGKARKFETKRPQMGQKKDS